MDEEAAGDENVGAEAETGTDGEPGIDPADAIAAIDDRLAALDRFLDARGTDRATVAVLVTVVLGLLARLFELGARTAHFDEGRVGYWALHLADAGEYYYWPLVHGPLLQFVDAAVFTIAGADDFTLRVAVALIGALLPLPLLLLREHLRDGEIVAAAAFLAANPVLLYYSRFYRSTIPVAAFSFAAFACFVRYYDARRPRFLYAGVSLFALAFTAKENAVVYAAVWIGASGLLILAEFLRPRSAPSGRAWVRGWWNRTVAALARGPDLPRIVARAALSIALFAVVVLYFYAPRAGPPGGIAPDGVGFDRALADPTLVPALIETTVIDIVEGYAYWFAGAGEAGGGDSVLDQYAEFLGRTLVVLGTYAPALVGFAAAGVAGVVRAAERRDLVLFAAAWGFVSVLGYPLGTDIFGAWIAVNALVPLAIPAGVGVAMVARWGWEALEDGDGLSAGIVAFLAVVVVAQMVGTGAAAVYANPQSADNRLVQYAQPADDLEPTFREVEALAADNDGTDVLFYGASLHGPGRPELSFSDPLDDTRKQLAIEPACANLGATLPLQWYLRTADANASCARAAGALDARLSSSPPPVIIADADEAGVVAGRLPAGYERRTLRIRRSGDRMAVFLDTNRSASAPATAP